MPFQRVPLTALFTSTFTGPNGATASFGTYSRRTTGLWDETSMTGVAADLEAAVGDYMVHVSNEWTFDNIKVRDLNVAFGRVVEVPTIGTVGSLASPSLPANVALRATFSGEAGDAPRRGGINLLPPAESQVIGSLVDTAPLADLQSDAQDIVLSMTGSGHEACIVSRYFGTTVTVLASGRKVREPILRTPDATTNGIASVLIHPRVDSQRKRLPRE